MKKKTVGLLLLASLASSLLATSCHRDEQSTSSADKGSSVASETSQESSASVVSEDPTSVEVSNDSTSSVVSETSSEDASSAVSSEDVSSDSSSLDVSSDVSSDTVSSESSIHSDLNYGPFHEPKDPTCTEDGNIGYYYAEDGKYYDVNKNEISESNVFISKLGHALVHHDAVAPTATTDGSIEYWECSRCGDKFSDSEGKNLIDDADIVIPAIGYTYDTGEIVWDEVVEGEPLTAKVRLTSSTEPEAPVKEDEATVSEKESVDPTCTEDGYIVYEATYAISETNIVSDTKRVSIEKLGHSFDIVEYQYREGSVVKVSTCSRCLETKEEVVTPMDVTAVESSSKDHLVLTGVVEEIDTNYAYFRISDEERLLLKLDAFGDKEVTVGDTVIFHGEISWFGESKVYLNKGNPEVFEVIPCECNIAINQGAFTVSGLDGVIKTHQEDVPFTINVTETYLKVGSVKVNGNVIEPTDGTYYIDKVNSKDINVEVTLIDKCATFVSGYDVNALTVENLVSGKYAITTTKEGVTYYLPLNTGNAAPAAKSFDGLDNLPSNILWDFNVEDDGRIYISQEINGETYYLVANNTNNGVRAEKKDTLGEKEYWKVVDGALCYEESKRYLGIYGTQDWRSYNSATHSNYKDSATSLKFYIYSEREEVHHTLTKVDAVAPTCTKAGHKEYYTCSVCGRVFADAEGHEIIEDLDAWLTSGDGYIAPLGHEIGEPEWKWAEDGKSCKVSIVCEREQEYLVENADAIVEEDLTQRVEPKVGEIGYALYVASYEYDGKTYTDSKVVEIPAIEPTYNNEPDYIIKSGEKWMEHYSCTNSDDPKFDKDVEVNDVILTDGTYGYRSIDDATGSELTLVSDYVVDSSNVLTLSRDLVLDGDAKTFNCNVSTNSSFTLKNIVFNGVVALNGDNAKVIIEDSVNFNNLQFVLDDTTTLDVLKTKVTLPAGYKLVQAGEDTTRARIVVAGVVTVLHSDSTHTDYATFQEAIDNASAGETIKLLEDVNVDVVTLSKDITFDLNSLTLTATSFTVGANVSVSNGTLVSPISVNEGATLVLGLGSYSDENVKNYIDLTVNYARKIENLMVVYVAEYVVDEAVAPTCEGTGLTEGKHEAISGDVIIAQEVVPALGHAWGAWEMENAVLPTATEEGLVERTCTRDPSHTDMITLPVLNEENYTIVIKTDSTCTAKGVHTYTLKSDTTISFDVEDIDMKAHTLAKHDAVAPTCTEAGSIEYYECSVCGKLFSDAEGTHEITLEETVVAPLGHDYQVAFNWVSKDEVTITVTCSKGDYNHVYDPANVDTTIEEAPVISSRVTKDPTCTEVGTREYYVTYVFAGKEYVDTYSVTEEVPANGHTYVTPKDTTYEMVDGQVKVVDKVCSVCGDKTYADTTLLTGSEASVNANQDKVKVVYGVVSSISGSNIYIDNGKFEFFNVSNKSEFDVKVGDVIVGYGKITYYKKNKQWEFAGGNTILAVLTKTNAVAPTCEVAGTKAYLTLVDGEKTYYYTEEMTFIGEAEALATWIADGGAGYVAPLGHNYQVDESTKSWNEDYSSFEITFVCQNDNAHTVTKTVTTTETADGVITNVDRVYTATIHFEGQDYVYNVTRPKTAAEAMTEVDAEISAINKELAAEYTLPNGTIIADYYTLGDQELDYVWKLNDETVTKVVYGNPATDTDVKYVLNVMYGETLVGTRDVVFTLKSAGNVVGVAINSTYGEVVLVEGSNESAIPSNLVTGTKYNIRVKEDATHIIDNIEVSGVAEPTIVDNEVEFTAGDQPVVITVTYKDSVNLTVVNNDNVTLKYFVGGDEVNEMPTTLTIGSTFKVVATAKEGYRISAINGASGSELELTVAKENINIEVTTVQTFLVTYNLNGGTGDNITERVDKDGNAVNKTEGIVREGYAFDGWYTSTDGGTTLADEAFAFDSVAITEDTTLYAKWVELYTVTFNTMGGSSVDALSVRIDATSLTVTKPADPTKTGFTFGGWYTSSDEGTTLSETAFDFTAALTGDVTVYAKWNVQAKAYTLVNSLDNVNETDNYVIVSGSFIMGALDGKVMKKVDGFSSDLKTQISNAQVIKFEKSGEKYKVKIGDNYLCSSSVKNLSVGTTSVCLFSIEFSGDNIEMNDGNGYLKYNSSNPRFTTYKTGQTDIQLYKVN